MNTETYPDPIEGYASCIPGVDLKRADLVLYFPACRIRKLDDESLKRLHKDGVLGANERTESGHKEDGDAVNRIRDIVERVAWKRGLTLPDHYEDEGRTVWSFS